jgi:pyrroline-5-carboxylate reductase
VALRPAVVRQVLPTLAGALRGEKLVVSIAAGVTLAELEAMLRPGTRVVRVMPNAPCQVGRGASGFALGSAATPADRELVEEMLRAVGIAEEVAGDKELDAVTGLSGSGPAYVARVVEALAEGGVGAGLEEGVALRLAEQTVLGAAALMAEKSIRPDALWKKIATPGGTTIEGLKVLEEKGLRGALIGAVGAATKRASELAQGGKAKKGNP